MENFLALEASAGSGKTFALSIRYIALILSGARVGEITALTFTKKAANEMKSRIIDTFINLHDNAKSQECSEICILLNKSKEEIIYLRDKFINDFLNTNLKISTFDSFFGYILKSFALNIGLNPNFSMDENIINFQHTKFLKDLTKEPGLLDRVAKYILNSKKSINDFFSSLDSLDESNIKFEEFKNSEFPDFSNIEEKLARIRQFCMDNNASNTAINMFRGSNISQVLSISALCRTSLNYRTFCKVYTPKLDEMFFELKDEIKAYCDKLEKYSLSELAVFIKKYKKAKYFVNKKMNALTFNDVVSQTYRLFNDSKFDTNLLYFRLDSRITHLLIDEFQDTNVLQYEIITPLICEIVAGYGQNGLGSFFYVGDKKQSIYRFRGGKKELFDKLLNDYSQIKKQNLDTNYRSLKLIVKFVNFVFKDEIQDYVIQKSAPYKEEFHSGILKDYILQNRSNFDLFNIEDDDFGYIKSITSDDMRNCVVSEVLNLMNKGALAKNIAVLCWKNDDIDKIQDALLANNIISSTQSMKLLFNKSLVKAVLEYAKFCLSKELLHAENVKSLIGHCPGAVSFDLNKNALKTVKFISEILKINSSDEDMLLFYEVAKNYESITDLVFSNDSTPSFSQNGDGVKIMTVHKSKGLQFGHVVLCDKMGKSRPDYDNFIYEYDIKNGWQIKQNLPKECVDEEFAKFKKRSKKLDYEEDINKLYVAFTRAEKSLIIIKQSEPNGNRPSFFTPYNEIKYLQIPDFEFGFIVPDKKENEPSRKSNKKIVFEKIPLQEIQDTNDDDESDLSSVYFGTALHYTLEMCDEFSENSLQNALKLSKARYLRFLNQDSFDDINKRVLSLFKNEMFLSFLDNAKVYKEVPFKINSQLKQIDIMIEKKDEILILDYKSSIKFIEKNMDQVDFYKKAVFKFYPDKKIRAFLIFLLKAEIKILEV